MESRRTGRFSALTALALFAAASPAAVADQRALVIDNPPTSGLYRVTGALEFNPGAIESPGQVAIFAVPETNSVPFTVLSTDRWPEQGIVRLTIAFIASDEDIRAKRFIADWGPVTSVVPADVDMSLPELRMEMAPYTGTEDAVLPVGTLVVKVRERPELWYYWYLAPIAGIIALLMYRKRKYYRDQPPGDGTGK